MKAIFSLFKQTFKEWSEDKAARLAAALAYYTVFAIAPLLVLMVLIAGLVFGPEAARGELAGQIEGAVGAEAAQLVQEMIDNAGERTSGDIFATVFGFIALILGATGLFVALEDALNTVWDVEAKSGGGFFASIKSKVIDRLWAFLLVIGLGLLMIAALLVSTALNVVVGRFGDLIPGLPFFWYLVNIAMSAAVLTVALAAIYKVLPDVEIKWADVWVGAAVTAVLFVIGKELLSLYLGRASVGSVYGAAGSLVVILVWIYYSAQILLFGAEFTQVYAKRYGAKRQPEEDAVPITDERRAEQGMPREEKLKEAEREDQIGRDEERLRRVPLPWAVAERYSSLVMGLAFGWLLASMGLPRGKK